MGTDTDTDTDMDTGTDTGMDTIQMMQANLKHLLFQEFLSENDFRTTK